MQSICNPDQIMEPLCCSTFTVLQNWSITDVFEITWKKSFKSLSLREHRPFIPINQIRSIYLVEIFHRLKAAITIYDKNISF